MSPLPPPGRKRSGAQIGRICFITTEFHGLFKNGGIGTSNTGLALALADAGFEVTVAFANADENGPRVKSGNFAELQAAYRTRGILLEFVPPHVPKAFNDPRTASFSVYAWLEPRGFDVVLFNDNGGQGFYAILAKHAGIFQNPPTMVVVAHGPFDWVLELNAMEYWSRDPVMVGFMERRCAEAADRLVSPSQYLVGWMEQRGWVLPPATSVIQNLIGVDPAAARAPSSGPAAHVEELVFFGRQEVRKGLALFCDALDLLHASGDLAGLTVTFLGKFSKLGSLHSGIYLAERARDWRVTLRLAVDLDQTEALAYLARPGVLAVIPSLAENSPCVVLECLQLGLPFLATDSGGTAELIAPQSRPSVLFAPDAAALAARLLSALPGLPPPAVLAITQDATRDAWIDVIAEDVARARTSRGHVDVPADTLVSVCLVHQLGLSAADCLSSVRRQGYANVEILLAWDGLASMDGMGDGEAWVIETGPCDLGTARNAAAAAASQGGHLLFVDPDGVTLLDDALARLAGVAGRLGADIVCGLPANDPASLVPAPQTLSVGACLELGGFENCFGRSVLLVAKPAFQRSGGFAQGGGADQIDWMLLASLVLQGCRLEIVPGALFEVSQSHAPAFDAGRIVTQYRQLMAVYADAPASVFSHIIEGLMRFGSNGTEGLAVTLKHTGQAAIDLARRMANIEPNGAEASRAFVNYCCERRMAAVALDFAMLNGGLHLIEATQATARILGADALAAIRKRAPNTLHAVNLSNDVATRIRATAPARAADITRPKHGVVTHEIGPDAVVLKAAGVCPPGAVRLRAQITRGEGGDDACQLAIAICDPHARLMLADLLHAEAGGAVWSGWIDLARGQDKATVDLKLPAPLSEVFDFYLLSRRREPAFGRAVGLTWTHVEADLQMTVNTTPSRIVRTTTQHALSVERLRSGKLVTDVSAVGFPVFVPGPRTLLHPIPGRSALVRLQAAFPTGGTGLKVRIGVDDERAHPIDFALWIAPSKPGIREVADLPEADGFSGWFTVQEAGIAHFLEVELREAAAEPLDIYFSTRVSQHPDVHFCHAYWHEFFVVERLSVGRQLVSVG